MPDPVEKIEYKRTEEFESLYANNVQYEASVWDLKMVFGQLDQAKGPSFIEQHTAVALAWPEVMIAAYFMVVNIVGYQTKNGSIQIPKTVIPPRPDPSDSSLDADGKKLVGYLAGIHDQFFGPNPFIPPSTP